MTMNDVRYEHSGNDFGLLIEQVIAGGGLSGIVRLLSDSLGILATVTDDEFEPLHAFAPRGRHLSRNETLLPQTVRRHVTFNLAGESRASTAPPTRHFVASDHTGYTVAPIVLPAGIVGYVWASDPSGALSERAQASVSYAAAACAVEMIRQRAVVEGESRVRNSFLEELLMGDIASVSSTRRRARFLGYDLRGEQIVFALDLDNFSAYIGRHHMKEDGIQQLKERFRRAVETNIPAVWSRTLIWEYSDAMIVLAPVEKTSDLKNIRERVDMLRAKVEQRLSGPSVSAGIGRPSTDLTKLPMSYREAAQALQVGMARSGPSSTTTFTELGTYRLLFHLVDHPELEAFCGDMLGPLERYEDKHGTHLLSTLQSYLDLQGNLSQTARELHLHRNGLLYRLTRIQEISGCDLENPTQRLALQLALLGRTLLQRKGGKKPAAPASRSKASAMPQRNPGPSLQDGDVPDLGG